MLYKKVTIWLLEGESIITQDYEKVSVTISGNYLILSVHNEESTEVTTHVYDLKTVKNWRTYIN
jgi:hypothetical protein